MTGQEDILTTCSVITERLEEVGDHCPPIRPSVPRGHVTFHLWQVGEQCPPISVLPVYSLLPSELQART